jgi:hypothetical protein
MFWRITGWSGEAVRHAGGMMAAAGRSGNAGVGFYASDDKRSRPAPRFPLLSFLRGRGFSERLRSSQNRRAQKDIRFNRCCGATSLPRR